MAAGVGVIESLPEGSAVVHVGGASFLSPWREFRASPSQLARLQVAAMLEPVNDMGPAVKSLLAGIETEMFREAKRRAKIPEGRAIRTHPDDYIEDGPLALVPARFLRLPVVRTDEGPVYAPEPTRGRPIGSEEHDHDPLADERARLDGATMDDGQAWRLATADFYAERAEALREVRPKGARIGDDEKAAANTARRILIQLRREVLQNGETDAVRARIRNAEHLADQEGRAARRRALAIKRTELVSAGFNRWERVRQLWVYRGELRKVKTGRNVDGLTLLDLTRTEEAAAWWFRALYQRTERGARVASWEGRAGGEPADRSTKDWGADLVTRKAVEARIMTAEKGNGRAITALRLVAGEGRTLRSLAPKSGANQALYREALFRALDTVADYRGMQ